MFGGLLELSEVTVSDIMVHRTKMRTLDADLPPDELVREVLASPYTRTPLWRGDPDNIIGMLHAKDLFRAYAAAGGDASRINAADIALEAWFVPEATTLRDQLKAFLSRKIHSALVVDEYGVVLGLLTLEDIIEEIVGDIKDEHDVAGKNMVKVIGGKGKVAVITGFFSVEAHELRRKGFEDEVAKEAPGITIVGRVENKDKADTAYSQAQDFMTANPDLSAIYVTAGGPFGAAKAVEDAARAGR